jgi:CBS domain-containing protein/gamma-glutamylcysteine synthetase
MPFTANCLSDMETHINDLLAKIKQTANELGTDIILTGILPTIRKFDLSEENMTPIKRYNALCKAIVNMRGHNNHDLNIRGIDELMLRHDSPLLEGCNTGFQIHLQVTPEEFASKYNIAQAIAGPALAIGTNSPLLFGLRLWHETRIALFQQAIDVRVSGDNLRNRSARVMFGNSWVKESILEIYREDIARFKILLGSTGEQINPFELIKEGETPSLHNLSIHNSTIYRWNRPCYGVSPNGQPHLRIENRVLPAGPTVKDEMANAALWLGLMNGMEDKYGDITKLLDFDVAKANFMRACRNGMNSTFTWVDGKSHPASDLLKNELIPIAIAGLVKAKIAKKDIEEYMNILVARIDKQQTGSQWMLNSYTKLLKETSREEAKAAITASIVKQQKDNTPVHEWRLAEKSDIDNSWNPSELIVEDFMQTDLFTVYEDDIVQLIAEIMDWQKLKYIIVENKQGKLVGLITARIISRHLLSEFYDSTQNPNTNQVSTKDLMIKNPITISSSVSLQEAMRIMQEHNIGCLPVVRKTASKNDLGELLGVITEDDYLSVAGRLIYKPK